jgi:Ni,Fe-hydrogenase III component G
MPDNEFYRELGNDEFRDYCVSLNESGNFLLRLMFATDERAVDGCFKIYVVFSRQGEDAFHIPFTKLKEDNARYAGLTPYIPAVHWYEREIRDMFGLIPEGHPDLYSFHSHKHPTDPFFY